METESRTLYTESISTYIAIFKMKNNKSIEKLFPLSKDYNSFVKYLEYCEKILQKKSKNPMQARISGTYGKQEYKNLVKKYTKIPSKGEHYQKLMKALIEDFFSGIPRWRSPLLVHNVGAPTNVISSSLYSLAVNENIYNINDGLAGNALIAEQIVVNLLSRLAYIKSQTKGFFTFGGTATNLYAAKVGIKKADPKSGKKGIKKKLKMLITEDSHFSHLICADWLGVGTENVVTIDASTDRRSNVKDAEKKMKKIFDSGGLVSSIIINGGTTYDHTIDNIGDFVRLRDNMVEKYDLEYKPHIHVDSVIGWSWLFFNDYDWKANRLKIDKKTLDIIHEQTNRIAQLKYADSWGVDFHKAIGGCPIPCSLVIFNNPEDINYLSKKEGDIIRMAQINEEFCFISPVDFTLETSRPGGAPIAALGAIYSLGIEGFQSRLANLLSNTILLKEKLGQYNDIVVCNYESLGFVTMLRIYPPEFMDDKRKNLELTKSTSSVKTFIKYVNDYMKEFFEWDFNTRILKNIGVEYSYSGSYLTLKNNIKISAIKIYAVSPYFSAKIVDEIISTLINQKTKFDNNIWKK